MNRTPATFRLALQSMGFNDIPLFITAKPAKDIAVGRLPIGALDLGRIGCSTKAMRGICRCVCRCLRRIGTWRAEAPRRPSSYIIHSLRIGSGRHELGSSRHAAKPRSLNDPRSVNYYIPCSGSRSARSALTLGHPSTGGEPHGDGVFDLRGPRP